MNWKKDRRGTPPCLVIFILFFCHYLKESDVGRARASLLA